VLRERGHKPALAIAPDSIWLAAADYDRTVRLWDMRTGERGPVLKGHDRRVELVDFSPDGAWLASVDAHGTILIWEVTTWTPVALMRVDQPYPTSCRWLPDGSGLCAVAFGAMHLLDFSPPPSTVD
jgi:WD40 repeat protein